MSLLVKEPGARLCMYLRWDQAPVVKYERASGWGSCIGLIDMENTLVVIRIVVAPQAGAPIGSGGTNTK